VWTCFFLLVSSFSVPCFSVPIKKKKQCLCIIINDIDLKRACFLPPQGQTIGVPSSHAYNKKGNSFDRSTSCGRWSTGPIFLRHTGCRFNVVAVHMIKVDMPSSSDGFDCHEDIAVNTCGICQFLNMCFFHRPLLLMFFYLQLLEKKANILLTFVAK
jgi:hypothetical protein